MCGVPYHAAEGYLARLIQKGYRVAICDQVEDARFAKNLVRREITRVVTPGTATESHLLRSHENNYLAAVCRNGARAGLAHVDVSTGEFRVTEIDAVIYRITDYKRLPAVSGAIPKPVAKSGAKAAPAVRDCEPKGRRGKNNDGD